MKSIKINRNPSILSPLGRLLSFQLPPAWTCFSRTSNGTNIVIKSTIDFLNDRVESCRWSSHKNSPSLAGALIHHAQGPNIPFRNPSLRCIRLLVLDAHPKVHVSAGAYNLKTNLLEVEARSTTKVHCNKPRYDSKPLTCWAC